MSLDDYDWDSIFDGRVVVLEKGTDFEGAPTKFALKVRYIAQCRGQIVSVTRDGRNVVVRALTTKPRRLIKAVVVHCPICNTPFQKRSKKQRTRFCSRPCREESYRRDKEARLLKVIGCVPLGHYVYGWCAPGEVLPFYVGKGKGTRAIETHLLSSSDLAACEAMKRSLGDTQVVLYKDNLTEDQALLVEGVLIDIFKSMGAASCNIGGKIGKPSEFKPRIA